MNLWSNIAVERGRQQATLVGSLRGFAAPATLTFDVGHIQSERPK